MTNATQAIDAVEQLKMIQTMRLSATAVDKRHAERMNRAIRDIRETYDSLFREPKTIADYDRAWAIIRGRGAS